MCIFLEKIQNVIKLGTQINVHNDLKSIIEDHQTVMKWVKLFFKLKARISIDWLV